MMVNSVPIFGCDVNKKRTAKLATNAVHLYLFSCLTSKMGYFVFLLVVGTSPITFTLSLLMCMIDGKSIFFP